MATIDLGTPVWGSGPPISINFSYEKRRIGPDMQYWVWVWIYPISGSGYFGYPIYLDAYINGQLIASITLKNAYPSRWGTAISWQSPWVTVPNKTTGTTPVSFRVYSGSGSSRDQTFSYNMAIDHAASTFSIENGTLGVAQNISITKQNPSFTHTIIYNCGTISDHICYRKSEETISWTPPMNLASQSTMSTSTKATITCISYSGDSEVGRYSKGIDLKIPESVKPAVSLKVSDAENVANKYGDYVKGKSKLKVLTTITNQYGASTNRFYVEVDGQTYNKTEFTTDYLKNAGDLTIKASVADGRGREGFASVTKKVLDYNTPMIKSIDASRCNANGENNSSGKYIRVDFSAEVTPLNNKNTATYSVLYLETGTTTWTTVPLNEYTGQYNVYKGKYIFEAEPSKSYAIKIQVSDDFATTEQTTSGTTTRPVFSICTRGLGFAVGAVANGYDEFKSGYKLNVFDGNVTMNGRLWLASSDSSLYVNGKSQFAGRMFDRFDTEIGNGLVKYDESGIDPNTTLEHAIITNKNTPIGNGEYMYILTYFYQTKSTGANRIQIAYPYNKNGSEYRRYYYNNTWSEWDGDTGWVSIAEQTSGGEAPAYVRYRKKNGYVTVTGTSHGQWSVDPGRFRYFNTKLPEGCRPEFDIASSAVSRTTGGYEFQVNIEKDGTVSLYNTNPSSAWPHWGFTVTFPV